MADQKEPPYSEIVREYGDQQAEFTLKQSDAWRSWAEQLDELIRDMPHATTVLGPWVYDDGGDRDRVAMGADHVDPSTMRARLYRVVADADAVAAALTRAAVLASEQSEELANALAIDEAAESGEDGESRG